MISITCHHCAISATSVNAHEYLILLGLMRQAIRMYGLGQ